MIDTSVFPDPVYNKTVLAPLFEGAKTHFATSVQAINRAHLVMLAETGIVTAQTAATIAGALHDIDATIDIAALKYTGEFEDYFFLVEDQLKKRIGPDVAGALHTGRSRNDMDHTAFKLVLTRFVDDMLALGCDLAGALIGLMAWIVLLLPEQPSLALVMAALWVIALGSGAMILAFAAARDISGARMSGTVIGIANCFVLVI
ncbi:MAG: hypothetical protein ACC619_05915, partial [Paracoccaceae bacterium]